MFGRGQHRERNLKKAMGGMVSVAMSPDAERPETEVADKLSF